MVLLNHFFRQQGLNGVLIGLVYGCIAGLIFVPLMEIYPQHLSPLWPFLLFSLALICLLVGQTSPFDQDYQEGILTWYYVHHSHLRGYLLVKYVAHTLLMVGAILSVTFLFGMGQMERDILSTLLLTQGVAIAALSAIHMVTSSLLLNIPAYRRSILQLLILIPLVVPLILLSYGVIEAGHFARPLNSLFVLFLSLSIVIIVIALAITPLALRESLRD